MEHHDANRDKREIVLAPGEYAYMQDVTTGTVKTYAGACVINQTAQEAPVIYEPETGSFKRVDRLEEAVRKSPVAVEGYYLVLLNPVKGSGDEHPVPGQAGKAAPDLEIGRKVNIPGPRTFPLWPGQAAQFLRGHHLRSNQYLLVRVYNEEEARANWAKAVVKPAADADTTEESSVVAADVPDDLTVGRLFVVKGTEVSFYIPPTGISVVGETRTAPTGGSHQQYVRNALTLERLEYCILVDENGNKRYERGPKVVFPEPTEKFLQKDKERAFRPIELNEIQGIHIKVIADYTEDDGTERKEGEELFITGETQQIYFPREEHAIIKYDGRSKHFATAIPNPGEARYVMDRMNGGVEIVEGPTMLLPDPRTHVIVQRILTDKECERWYPGNKAALDHNRALRRKLEASKGDTNQMKGVPEQALYLDAGARRGDDQMKAMSFMSVESHVSRAATSSVVGDEMARGNTFTEPRTITLDNKFDGVPSINIFTGFAVMLTSKGGERRVEVGPKTVLVGYDETLEALQLSTDKPKTTDVLLDTVYLRVSNNQVSDIVKARTADRVEVSIKVSMWIDFEGEDREKWFSVENYVKFACDRVRSMLKARLRSVRAEELDERGEDLVRETILGDTSQHPEGLVFDENGMRIKNMEVLTIEIHDKRIEELLQRAQFHTVESTVNVQQAEFDRELHKRLTEIELQRLDVDTGLEASKLKAVRTVQQLRGSLDIEQSQQEVEVEGARLQAATAKIEVENLGVEAELANEQKRAEHELGVQGARNELARGVLEAETKSVTDRFAAASNGFTEAVAMLTDRETLVKVSQAMSVQQIIGGDSVVDVIGKVFDKTPLKALVERTLSRSALPPKSDMDARGRRRGPDSLDY